MRPLNALTLTVIALAVTACGAEPATINPEAPAPAAATVYLAGEGDLWTVDTATDAVAHVPMEHLGGGDAEHRISVLGDRLVLWSYDMWSTSADDPGADMQRITQGSWIYIPAADPDAIWVGYLDPQTSAHERALGELRKVTADGRVLRTAEPFEGGWPIAEAGGGMLYVEEGGTQLVDIGSGEVLRSWDWADLSGPGPVNRDLLASCGSDCDTLVVTNLATGDQQRVQAPAGTSMAVFDATFSPDGRTIAVPVGRDDRGWRSYSENEQSLALVSLDNGNVEVVPGSEVEPGYIFTAWSAGGDQAFLAGGSNENNRDLVAYDIANATARHIALPGGSFYEMTAR